MRKVEVKPFNVQWFSMFEEEANKLHAIFDHQIIEIHHIGSTSVNGLKAKPIIDIMPVVRDINRIDELNKAMVTIGYEPKGENGISERRYFQKGGENRTHHVHVYESGNPEVERHLAFRDYLRVYPDIAKKYGDLKEELSQFFPYDIESYIKGKEQLAQEIENKAVAWYLDSRV
ncbi:GrpB family protein [Filibacter tadaridae]|uniref:Dephospho-CoA kinase/protein folding accessory domain-containing protein n=1 Tax=Filibacter tadaridae TaxID=2483811 RepID=A0A3P5XQN0_9BACL|nr:GrpB family protein [Filibacter tadaridae]VDC32722.1 dephospho-CoA kinase/protein folding accessory domain-containing protein [Filibacter tadaridae]